MVFYIEYKCGGDYVTIFDIEIANIDIAPLKNYFKHYLPPNIPILYVDAASSNIDFSASIFASE